MVETIDVPEKHNISSLTRILQGDIDVLNETLDLDLGGYTMRVSSNHLTMLDYLAKYFSHVTPATSKPDIETHVIDREVVDSGLTFTDWAREPGKTGRKDAFFDILDARLVLKVRTGMLFLQSETACIAAGPCLCDS